MSASRQGRTKPVQGTVAYRYLAQFLQTNPASPTLPTSSGAGFDKGRTAATTAVSTTSTTSNSCNSSQEASDVPPLTHSPAATVISADDNPLTPPGTRSEEKFTFLQDDVLESKATTLTTSILGADGSLVKQPQQRVDSITRHA
ncbi:hypothetical protein FQN49_003885 [Arthroderma sp. PD_2]|nr:hypothetical protein FQN49_003885 [Arthroderma sp. PD_2]